MAVTEGEKPTILADLRASEELAFPWPLPADIFPLIFKHLSYSQCCAKLAPKKADWLLPRLPFPPRLDLIPLLSCELVCRNFNVLPWRSFDRLVIESPGSIRRSGRDGSALRHYPLSHRDVAIHGKDPPLESAFVKHVANNQAVTRLRTLIASYVAVPLTHLIVARNRFYLTKLVLEQSPVNNEEFVAMLTPELAGNLRYLGLPSCGRISLPAFLAISTWATSLETLDLRNTSVSISDFAHEKMEPLVTNCTKLRHLALPGDVCCLNVLQKSQSLEYLEMAHKKVEVLFRKRKTSEWLQSIKSSMPPNVGLRVRCSYLSPAGLWSEGVLERIVSTSHTTEELLLTGLPIDFQDFFCGNTLLHYLIIRGEWILSSTLEAAIQELLETLHADPTIRNYTGHENVFEIALNSSTSHSPNITQATIDYLFGAPFKRALQRFTATELLWNRGGGVALLNPHLSFSRVNWILAPERIKLLAVDVNITDAENNTPLFFVRGIDEALLLIRNGADCGHINRKGISAAKSLNRFCDIGAWKIPNISTILTLIDLVGSHFSPNAAFVEAYCANFSKDTLRVIDRVLKFIPTQDIPKLFKNALHVATARQCSWIVDYLMSYPNDTLHQLLVEDIKAMKKTRVGFCKVSKCAHSPMHCLFHKGNAEPEDAKNLLKLFAEHGLDVNLPAADGTTRCVNVALYEGHTSDWLSFLLLQLIDANASFDVIEDEIQWNNFVDCFNSEKEFREAVFSRLDLRRVCCRVPERIDFIWQLTKPYSKLPVARILRTFMQYEDCEAWMNWRQPTGVTPLLALVDSSDEFGKDFVQWQEDMIACFIVAGAKLTDKLIIGHEQVDLTRVKTTVPYLEWCAAGQVPQSVIDHGRKLLILDT